MAGGGDLGFYIGSYTTDANATAFLTGRGYTQAKGYLYYDSTMSVLKVWDGTNWVALGAGSSFVTAEGGFAVMLTNKTGANSVKGTLVQASTGTDKAFIAASSGSYEPIGAVYLSGIADGSLCPVVVGGIVDVLLEDSTASTRGYWARTSTTTAGRADITNAGAPGLVLSHFAEIGHCLESKSSGTNVLARICMHFN
jgi:hypothetical protein